MVDVFISYSRTDQALVRRLAEAVKRLGYSVWWDDELPPHLSYCDVITEKIGEAKAAIVVWSEDAAASEWVRAEADVARNQKKLIQTSIDGRMPPMPFNQIQFAAIGDWHGEEDHPGWTKVKASLEALCGAPGAVALPSAPRPAPTASPIAAPAPAGGGSRLVPVLLALLVLAVLMVGYVLWSRGERGKPEAHDVASATVPAPAPQEVPPPARTDATFTEAATIAGPEGFGEIRGGPSAEAFAVGRVNRGEVFTTYPQQGEWWQVRIANGTTGYLPRARIRLMSAEAPAPRAAAQRPAARTAEAAAPRARARAQAAKPAAGAAQPQVLQMPMNPRRYCMGPGRGTAECEQLRARFSRQRGYR